MKITKEQLEKMIAESIEEHLGGLAEQMPGQPQMPEEVFHDLHTAMSALRNASAGMKKAGLKAVEVDDCFFKVKRLLDSMTQTAGTSKI